MKKILLGFTLFISLTQIINAIGQTPVTTIAYISVYPNATIIRVANAHGNEDGCTFSAATSFLLLPNDGSFGSNSLYAALLSAQATGTTVTLGYSGCSQNFPTMNRIDFVQ